jgi:hypothetical protein
MAVEGQLGPPPDVGVSAIRRRFRTFGVATKSAGLTKSNLGGGEQPGSKGSVVRFLKESLILRSW